MPQEHDRVFGPFRFLTGDVNYTDYGGSWYRKVGERRYHVLRLDNWNEIDSSAVPDYGTYCVGLSEVDLQAIGPERIKSALECCGYEIHPDHGIWVPYSGDTIAEHGSAHFDLVLVECCHIYGARAPLAEESGNNWRKLVREHVRESRSLDDPKVRRKAMRKPVNRIGSTAAEYMRGDIHKAVVRGVIDGKPEAMLMAKLGMARK